MNESAGPPEIQLSQRSPWNNSIEIKIEPDSDDEEHEAIYEERDDQNEKDDAALKAEADPDIFRFNESIQYLLQSQSKLLEVQEGDESDKQPKNFCSFEVDDRPCFGGSRRKESVSRRIASTGLWTEPKR